MNDRDSGCPNPLHDYPILQKGYAHHLGEADRRLDSGWENPTCPDCDYGGWIPPISTSTPNGETG